MGFRVQQIDHVEVFVPKREEPARRLERTHAGARSIYFDDPWGAPYEITTYDIEG